MIFVFVWTWVSASHLQLECALDGFRHVLEDSCGPYDSNSGASELEEQVVTLVFFSEY